MSAVPSTLELVELLSGHPLGDDEPLLFVGEREMLAGEAKKAAVTVGFQLREQGVQEGDLVVVDPTDELELIPALFGVWAARAAVVVVDSDWVEQDRHDIRELLTPVAWYGPGGLTVAPESQRAQIMSPGPGTAYVEWRGIAADYLVHSSEDIAQAIASRPLTPAFPQNRPAPPPPDQVIIEQTAPTGTTAAGLETSAFANGMPPAPSAQARTGETRALDTPAQDPIHPTDTGPFAIGCRLSCHTGILTLLRAFLSGRAVLLRDD